MAENVKLRRLERQLSRDPLSPVGAVTNEALHAATLMVGRLLASLRQAAFDRPLTTLFLSCEAGYLVARLGRRRAVPARGANSFTMGEARRRIEKNGFHSVRDLAKDNDGIWRGKAQKGDNTVNVWLDYRGNVGESR
jgi:hypothetical protein